MHEDHEFVEFVPVDEPDYEEVIEEYEEEILVQEGAPEPFGADFADPSPAQGNPRWITHILMITEYISMMCILCYKHFMETTCINISTYESY